MDPQLVPLLHMAADLAGVTPASTERLGAAMLVAQPRGGWRSTLNNDGSPLQLSVGLGKAGARPAIRLIADPAAAGVDSGQRFQFVETALFELLNSHGSDMRTVCNSVVEQILPVDPDTRAALQNGGAWLAADLSGKGLALYATTRWGQAAHRWRRAQAWLDAILPAHTASREALRRLSAHTALVSAGVEGTSSPKARAKLYWRLGGTAALSELGLPLLRRSELADFLIYAIEDRRISPAAIVGSTSFRLADGAVSDVKLDICCHCVQRPWRDWMQVLRRCCVLFGLADFPLADGVSEKGAELAFIGLGIDADFDVRLNVYLKARTEMVAPLRYIEGS
jgi:hypothetical protein